MEGRSSITGSHIVIELSSDCHMPAVAYVQAASTVRSEHLHSLQTRLPESVIHFSLLYSGKKSCRLVGDEVNPWASPAEDASLLPAC